MVTLPRLVTPRISVSWDGSGNFDGPDDDVTSAAAADPGVRLDLGRDGLQALSPPKVGAGEVELLNDRATYSGTHPQSPVYQRVVPGRPVFYEAGFGVEGLYTDDGYYYEDDYYAGYAYVPLGRHVVDEITQTTEIGQRRVRLSTLGAETALTRSVVTVPLQTNIRTDQVVTLLLDAAGWPSTRRNIALGDTTLLYWWCDERSPWDALLEVLAAEGPGTFYVDRDGIFHFENRNYRTTQLRSQASRATFYDRVDTSTDLTRGVPLYAPPQIQPGAASGLWFTALTYDPAFKAIRNRATYATKRRQTAALGVVWTYGATLSLNANQTITLFARPSDPFINAVAPLSGTDFTITAGAASILLTYTSGLVAWIVITAGAAGATITGLQLRAQALTVVSDTVAQNGVDASASIAAYSPVPNQNVPLPLAVAGWPEVDLATATAVCDAWVLRYQQPRPQVTIRLQNADGRHVEQILARLPSDRITLIEANTGLATDVWINEVTLTLTGAGGRVLTADLGCEVCDFLTGAVWDLSTFDDSSSTWGV